MTHDENREGQHGAAYDGVRQFLLANAADGDVEAASVADRMARGFEHEGHLWRAMELGSRDDLRTLFEVHFPSLAAGNDRDMRWKKYLYKRLCGWPGFEG